MSYGNPILSIIGLVFFGFADLTDELFIATIMVFIAGVIGGYKFKRKKPEATETVQAP